jgi:hypothetical protein
VVNTSYRDNKILKMCRGLGSGVFRPHPSCRIRLGWSNHVWISMSGISSNALVLSFNTQEADVPHVHQVLVHHSCIGLFMDWRNTGLQVSVWPTGSQNWVSLVGILLSRTRPREMFDAHDMNSLVILQSRACIALGWD